MSLRLLLKSAAGALALVLAPIAFSPTQGLALNEAACFTGTCCPQEIATCNDGNITQFQKYYLAEGKCPEN